MDVHWLAPEVFPDHPQGAFQNEDGDLVVRVNASPDHPSHDGCWFEVYDGDPEDYEPFRGADPDEDGYVGFIDADSDHAERQAPANDENIARVSVELDELEREARDTLDGDELAARLIEIRRARP